MSCDPHAESPFTMHCTPGVMAAVRERGRQIDEEGFDAARDDRYHHGELAAAAACYLLHAASLFQASNDAQYAKRVIKSVWPWDWKWWKPEDSAVVGCVKAAALAMAELDRLARCVIKAPQPQPQPKYPEATCARCQGPMQVHPIHEVASLLYCPRCNRVTMEDPDGLTELRPVHEEVTEVFCPVCHGLIGIVEKDEAASPPKVERFRAAHARKSPKCMGSAKWDDAPLIRTGMPGEDSLPERIGTRVCCPVCEAILDTMPGNPSAAALSFAFVIAAPVHAEASPSCIASPKWQGTPILKPVLKGPSDAVPH